MRWGPARFTNDEKIIRQLDELTQEVVREGLSSVQIVLRMDDEEKLKFARDGVMPLWAEILVK